MTNHSNGMKIAWNNMVCIHRFMLCARRLRNEILNHFAGKWWEAKTVSMFKMGYEIFSNCAKVSSAIVPRVKNDCSLKMKFKEGG